MDWTSDSEEKEVFDWDSDEEAEKEEKDPSWVAVDGPSGQASEPGSSHFVGRGLSEDVAEKEIKENGEQDFDWESDYGNEQEDKEINESGLNFGGPAPSRPAVPGSSREACDAEASCPKLVSHFTGMGFPVNMVLKAIKENGEENTEAILETLLTYSAIEKSPSEHEVTPRDCSIASEESDFDDDLSEFDDFGSEEFVEDFFEKDRTVSTLVDMGFLAEDASAAIDRCGPNASVLELADSIRAAQMAEDFDDPLWKSPMFDGTGKGCAFKSNKDKKRRRYEEDRRNKKSRYYERKECMKKVIEGDDDVSSLFIPNPMVGFGLPHERPRLTHRNLHDVAIGPPYFYYENVALAPKGVWETISRYLYDIEPEFVDSKFFCAAARKRGYIHNLPISNRFPLLPTPAKTIHEAFPMTKKWWPSWDGRAQFNCLQTCIASAKLTERIRTALANSDDPPPQRVQQYVLNECRKWNLLWVGLHKVAPLEPDEIEMLLGFPRNHTRGGGISRTERYRSLGNSFQVDTVAFHLSVLKDMFPNGMNVLSLFSGIGGAEVALHRLGIHLKMVVSVEISEVNRNILRSWWEQTNQTGTLIHIDDVQKVNGDRLGHIISTYGGFDLVIGGSPCNNLAGSNRHTRIGLAGEHSSLFHDYCRILELVKDLMKKF